MPTDRERLVQHITGLAGSSPNITDVTGEVKAMQRRVFRLRKTAVDPAAGDATTNGAGNGTFCEHATVFRKSKLVAARLYALNDTNTTAHDTNYATINVTKCDGAGGATTVILTNTTKITGGLGNVAKISLGTYTNLTPSIVANVAECAAGSYLMIQIAKASAGVAMQPFAIELDFEEV